MRGTTLFAFAFVLSVLAVASATMTPDESEPAPGTCSANFAGTVTDRYGEIVVGATVQGPGSGEWMTDVMGRYAGRDAFPCDLDRVVLGATFRHAALEHGAVKQTMIVNVDPEVDHYVVDFTFKVDARGLSGLSGLVGTNFVDGALGTLVAIIAGFVITGGYRLHKPS